LYLFTKVTKNAIQRNGRKTLLNYTEAAWGNTGQIDYMVPSLMGLYTEQDVM